MPNPLWILLKLLYYAFKYSIFVALFVSFCVSDYGGEALKWFKSQGVEVCQAAYLCHK